MWADVALAGVSALKHTIAYAEADEQNKSDKAWQAYNNAMVKIGDAGNQNTITTNENLAAEAAALKKYALRTAAYKTKGSAAVAAAASGTAGRSVDIALYDIGRNEAVALDAVHRDIEVQFLQFDNQRAASAMQAKQSHDFRGLPGPNAATYMLGFASDLASIETQ